MFRSIRWRLVASYLSLTLLVVSLVGVLALSLVKEYTQQQELDYLKANAESVAQQAHRLMQPTTHYFELQELAHTSAFLGNVRVRILNQGQRTLADSGPKTNVDELVWIVPPQEYRHEFITEADHVPHMFMMAFSTDPEFDLERDDGIPRIRTLFSDLPPGTEFKSVQIVEDPLGNRFTFETNRTVEVYTSQTVTQTTAIIEKKIDVLPPIPETEKIPNSKQVITVPIGDVNNPIGYVELSNGPDFSINAIETARQAFLLATSGTLIMAILVGLFVSQSLTAPLRKLIMAASRMSGGDLSARASIQSQDEIGQLATQFNQMAERLEISFTDLAAERDSLRRFIADASHELRTPITALKNFNELLQEAAANDPVAQREFLLESQTQLRRLEWITHNLLDLSRLDAGLINLDIGNYDVKNIFEMVVSPFKARIKDKEIDLVFNLPSSPIQIQCDCARIELALSNLLDNALKFTSIGTKIEIGAKAINNIIQIWVQDTGPGISKADQAHLFERFYRGMNTDQTGSGLGLAIVESIVLVHKGRVFVKSSLGSGSCFTLELPHLLDTH